MTDGCRCCVLRAQSHLDPARARSAPCGCGVLPAVRRSPVPPLRTDLYRFDLRATKQRHAAPDHLGRKPVEALPGRAPFRAARPAWDRFARSDRARDAQCGAQGGRHRARPAGRAGRHGRGILGAQGCQFRDAAGRGAGHPRPQWRRQEHAVEDLKPHHRTDHGTGQPTRPRRQPARGRHRLSPRIDRPREHLPEWRDPRHDRAPRSAANSTRSSPSPKSRNFSIPRSSAIPRACMCASPSPSPRISNPRS